MGNFEMEKEITHLEIQLIKDFHFMKFLKFLWFKSKDLIYSLSSATMVINFLILIFIFLPWPYGAFKFGIFEKMEIENIKLRLKKTNFNNLLSLPVLRPFSFPLDS